MGATIGSDPWMDLLMKKTGSPVTEEEVPKLLRNMIEKGGTVTIELGEGALSLTLRDGKFTLEHARQPRPGRSLGVASGRSGGAGPIFKKRR